MSTRTRPRLTVTATDAARWRELRNRADTAGRSRTDDSGDRSWYRISNAVGDDSDTAVIHLYDEIGYFGVSASDFVAALGEITASTIDLRLNSPGGDVYDGLAIYNALIDHPANVVATVDGIAASAASYIAQAGDRVVMNRNAELMIHDAFGLCVGNAADMRDMATLLDKASDNIAAIYTARAGKVSQAVWRKRMEAETWYSASEAVAAGLADEATSTQKRSGTTSTPATEDSWDLSLYCYAGRAAAPDPDLDGPAEPAGRREAARATVPRVVINVHGSPDAAAVAADVVRAALADENTPTGETAPEPAGSETEAPAPAAVEDQDDHGPTADAKDIEVPAPEPDTDDPLLDDPEPEPEPEPAAEVSDWDAAVAHLTSTPAPATWSDAVAHLTHPPSVSAATTHTA